MPSPLADVAPATFARYRRAVKSPSRLLILAAAATLAGASQAEIIYAGPAWSAIDRGSTCEALSRSLRIAPKGKIQAIAAFAFAPDHGRWGEFSARLRRMPRAGAAVMLRIDDQPFLLVSRGNWAWSVGPQQEEAMIAALRSATAMSIETHDSAGQRVVDPYSVDGAATAIDAAAAACAGKIERR